MDIVTLARQGIEFIKLSQPALEVTTKFFTFGSAAVDLILKGGKLYGYFIGNQTKPDPKDDDSQIEIEAKPDVAILIDINRRMLVDVAQFLQKQEIDANLLLITNDPAYDEKPIFLDPIEAAEWEEIVKDFATAAGWIKRHLGNVQMHVFLSVPLPLAFGLGSVWGTVDECTVYHWQDGTYHPVMPISRTLRQ